MRALTLLSVLLLVLVCGLLSCGENDEEQTPRVPVRVQPTEEASTAFDVPAEAKLPPGLTRDITKVAHPPPDDEFLPEEWVVNERDGSILVPGVDPWRFGGLLTDALPDFMASLDAYFIAIHAVTNAQFSRFVEATGRREPKAWLGGEDSPVVNVSWFDAAAYCEWAGLRLPTELSLGVVTS